MFSRALEYIIVALLVIGINCDDVDLEIPQGSLIGETRSNRDGGIYYAFKGIPYGKPPINEFRFRATELADGWEGVRDAREDLPECIQISSADSVTMVGQEDCLHLNVFTPGVPAESVTGLAVMVFIHGGSFRRGSALETNMGANFLLTKDVVLVVINYRMGLFGFLTLDDPNLGATGNAGLKDQSLALQWVQSNIEYFGGDPNNVLLFGQSAGSMSVHHHLLSPMSTGLFAKALCESGTAFTPLAMSYNRNTAVTVAEYLGIQTDNWEDMMSSLREVSTEELYRVFMAMPNLFRPAIEAESNEPRFIERKPIDVIESGDFIQVPFLNGGNSLEGLNVVARSGDVLITDFTAYIYEDLEIEPGSEGEQDIVQRIKNFYYDGGESSREEAYRDIKLDTEFRYLYPHYRATSRQVIQASSPIYYYYFSADTALNRKNTNELYATYTGADHADEFGYLFNRPTTPVIEPGSVEDAGWRNMVELWTNFAVYSNPTPDGSDYTWEAFQENESYYLHIDTDGSSLKVDLLQESMDFWDSIYEDYYPST